ncbi:MAG: hypothetical protein JWO56_384 [Acidobacteria bacterium]|nr:hypothetical protein [Acidobacteriota bacterium]
MAGATRRRTAPRPLFPACDTVTGTPAVTFSRDGGQTFAPVEQKLEGVGYTYGVAALDASTLLSWHKSTLSISSDGGCSWANVGDYEDGGFPPSIVAGRREAYIYSDNRPFLGRFDVATRTFTTLKAPGSIIGLIVDPAMPSHLRVGTAEADIFDTVDSGASWTRVGIVTARIPLIYRIAFDPHDLNHILAGTVADGVLSSRDGGRNWTLATGLGTKGQVNAFQVLVSPADPGVAWAMALDMSDEASASHGRHVYRSTDGGLTFAPVVDASADVPLINGPAMAVHPTDPNVVYFVFGTYFQGYGTDLFRYDAATSRLTRAHLDRDDIDAIAFSPADPNVMYFGLEIESGVR